MSLDELRNDIIIKQKKGLPFIITSVVIWLLITVVAALDINIAMKNILVFCCSTPMLPLSWLIGKKIGVDIFSKDNELGNLGFLFTMNQILYLLIVIWVFNAVPDKMIMVYNGLWRTFTAVFMAVQIKSLPGFRYYHSCFIACFRKSFWRICCCRNSCSCRNCLCLYFAK